MTAHIRPAAVTAHIQRRQAAEQATAETVLAAIAALHTSDGKRRPRCCECQDRWPCRTARIIHQGER